MSKSGVCRRSFTTKKFLAEDDGQSSESHKLTISSVIKNEFRPFKKQLHLLSSGLNRPWLWQSWSKCKNTFPRPKWTQDKKKHEYPRLRLKAMVILLNVCIFMVSFCRQSQENLFCGGLANPRLAFKSAVVSLCIWIRPLFCSLILYLSISKRVHLKTKFPELLCRCATSNCHHRVNPSVLFAIAKKRP